MPKAAAQTARPQSPAAAPTTAAAPLLQPQKTSLWDEEFARELAEPTASASTPTPAANPVVNQNNHRNRARGKFAGRPWWFIWAAFLAYVAVVWLTSRSSPILSMLLVMPVFGLAILIFLFGALWYFAVLCRDSPGQAASLFFALLKSFLTGGSSTAAGRRHGTAYRDAPENPSLARPVRIMKLGALAFAFSLGATILVGIMLGAWTKENLRQHRFDQFENFAPPPPHILH
jgi:hypothetical protein